MATYLDYYKIKIIVNGYEFPIDPKLISFSMYDSIFSFYNTASMDLNDDSGLLQETLTTIKGSPIEIQYGVDRTVNHGTYTIVNDRFLSPANKGIMGGTVSLEMKNEWYSQQEISSYGVNDLISNIVRDITQVVFDTVDVETTIGSEPWYQPLVNDATFINDILTPNAYSENANNTPFFSYITNDNVFHFKSGYTMYSSNVAADLKFLARSQMENTNPNTILDVRRLREEADIDREVRNVLVYHIDDNTGKLEENTDQIIDHLSPGNKYLPYIADLSLPQSYYDHRYTERTTAAANRERAKINNYQRKGMFLEYFIVMLSFNPKLKSGQKVQITIFSSQEEDRSRRSQTYTDNYIIVSCEHIWSGEETKGYTRLVVGRKYMTTNNTFTLRSRLAR